MASGKCRRSAIKPGVIDALFVHHVMTDLWQSGIGPIYVRFVPNINWY
jgi:hypothetical protein